MNKQSAIARMLRNGLNRAYCSVLMFNSIPVFRPEGPI